MFSDNVVLQNVQSENVFLNGPKAGKIMVKLYVLCSRSYNSGFRITTKLLLELAHVPCLNKVFRTSRNVQIGPQLLFECSRKFCAINYSDFNV